MGWADGPENCGHPKGKHLNRLLSKTVGYSQQKMRRFFLDKGFRFFEGLGLHVLPIHYYSPIPDTRELIKNEELWSKEKDLKGIDFNVEEQQQLLSQIAHSYYEEYIEFPKEKTNDPQQYYLNNGSFGFASGQIHYALVRHFKPKNIIEVGCGQSTLVSLAALDKNKQEGCQGEILAIEPYPLPYLRECNLNLIPKKVQEIDVSVFSEGLLENDILFIDSSHTVKMDGDVNFLMLEVLPALKKGVIVHIHDIQFPFDYFQSYITTNRYFWTEQYLVQAFLMYNKSFKVLLCASYMHHKCPELMEKCFSPYPEKRVPTSLYIQKVG